jgi:hypothetical protein
MSAVTWLGCNGVTGQIIEELPDLLPQGLLSHRLAAYTSTAFRLPLALDGYGAPPRNWEAATEPGRTMIVAVLNGRPVWAGVILTREGGTVGYCQLGCVTPEGYLDHRFVGDHNWDNQDEASVIATGLIGDANTTEGISLTIDAPATGTLRDREYFDRDDKTVYSALRELAGVDGGPEWTITLDWTSATQTAVKKTFRVRSRIGFVSAPATPTRPTGTASAVFSTEADSEARYTYREDYTIGKGANHIVALSSGEGDTRPQSSPARATNLFAIGWPRWEYRYTPSSSITNISTLDAHAASALTLMKQGARILTITARADTYPTLGLDWNTGDDIGYELKGHRHPNGLTGVSRAVGWDLDPKSGMASPVLFVPGEEI